MEAQVLDSNPIERERGITIKAQSVSLPYTAKRRQDLPAQLHRHPRPRRLQLRGQPLAGRLRRRAAGGRRRAGRGSAVGRQLLHRGGAGPGSGAGAQQDRPAHRRHRAVKAEIEAVIGIDAEDAVAISAKTGLNVVDVLEAIVQRIPPPKPRDTDKLQALIIDSWFDNYLGVVSLVRVMQGEIKPGDKLLVMSTGRTHQVDKVGVFTPKRKDLPKLGAGEVGWINASIKDVHGAPVGDTLTLGRRSGAQAAARLPGNAAARVRRPVPGRRRGLPGPARSAGQAAPQRRRAALRAGKLRGDGLRLPLRLPRHAAHGDRAGAPGARVQPQPDQHRADGDLRGAQDRRHDRADGQPGQAAAR